METDALELASVAIDVCALEPFNPSAETSSEEGAWSEDLWERPECDPWGASLLCSPCKSPDLLVPAGEIPTLEDLYKAREVCRL